MEDRVKLALKISTEAHKGQFRRDGTTPYITHPVAVAEAFKYSDDGKYSRKYCEELQSLALLHDVKEDSLAVYNSFWQELYENFFGLINAIDFLTRTGDDSYLSYILRIKEYENCRLVKIEDIKHNLSTLEPSKKTTRDKYELALYILEH